MPKTKRLTVFLFLLTAIAVAGIIWLVSTNWLFPNSIAQPTNQGNANQNDFDPANLKNRTFQNMSEEFTWQAFFDKLAPNEGDLAPDFELFDTAGKESVRLSQFRGDKPVALVFGSFT